MNRSKTGQILCGFRAFFFVKLLKPLNLKKNFGRNRLKKTLKSGFKLDENCNSVVLIIQMKKEQCSNAVKEFELRIRQET